MIGDQVVKVTISTILLVIIANMMVTVRQRRTDNKVEKEIDIKLARIEKEYGKIEEKKQVKKSKTNTTKKKDHGKRYKK